MRKPQGKIREGLKLQKFTERYLKGKLHRRSTYRGAKIECNYSGAQKVLSRFLMGNDGSSQLWTIQ